MAKTLDLRKYQEDILARIKERSRSAEIRKRSRLGVRAGDELLLVGLEDIGEVLPVPEIHPVPISKPWFLGMANVRGNLYGVSDVAQFLGRPATVANASSRVLLTHPKYRAHAALLVSAIVGLRSLDQLREQPDAANPGHWLGSRAYCGADGAVWREIDIAALLAFPDFLRVGLE